MNDMSAVRTHENRFSHGDKLIISCVHAPVFALSKNF